MLFPPGAPLRRGGVTKKNVGPRSAALRPHILGNFGGCAGWFQEKGKVVAAQERVREMFGELTSCYILNLCTMFMFATQISCTPSMLTDSHVFIHSLVMKKSGLT